LPFKPSPIWPNIARSASCLIGDELPET